MYRRGANKMDKAPKEESASSKYAELLVFGYACRLFRDDERAMYHEQGKHLIPWMGDNKLMIDRSVEQSLKGNAYINPYFKCLPKTSRMLPFAAGGLRFK